MGRRCTILAAIVVYLLIATTAAARAEPDAADDVRSLRAEITSLRSLLDAQRLRYEARLDDLQIQLDELVGRTDRIAEQRFTPDVQTMDRILRDAQAPSSLDLRGAIQSFNPEISVNADFLLHYGSGEGGELDEEFLLREVEIAFGGYIDPFARADIFLAIHKEHAHHEEEGDHEEEEDHDEEEGGHGGYGVEIEEAYLTLLTLPWDLQAKVGKFRAGFGKVNLQHLHALPWVEYPLVIQNYFGEEGLAGLGVSVSKLIPNPWDHYMELTYELFNNDNAHLFAGEDADDFVHLLHLKNFFDLSESSTLELGLSAATAPNDGGHGSNRTCVGGLDVTYRWRPPQEGLYKSLLWQTELLSARKDMESGTESSWGMFSALEYQLAKRWFIGGRYDFSELPDDAGSRENALSAYLTHRQSENCFWRLGYQFSNRNFEVAGREQDHQLWLQLNIGLGAHPAHKY